MTYRLSLLVMASIVCLPPAIAADEIARIDPPQRGFFSKKLDYQGIAVKAHAVVADEALKAGRDHLAMMLAHLPEATWNLAQEGVELHIIGKNQVTSDLPDYRHMKGKPFRGSATVDEASRGLTGLHASCGEEGLLHLSPDMYHGRDVCVHEFCHTLYDFGLGDEARKRIDDQWQKSTGKGLWDTAYAATRPVEYFAELSMWYFGTTSDTGRIPSPPGAGRDALRKYDPDGCQLLDALYGGKIRVPRKEMIRLLAHPASDETSLHPVSGVKSTIRLRNGTDSDLTIYSLDVAGKRTDCGSLAPGQSRDLDTVAGAVWVLADSDGKSHAVFVAEKVLGVAIAEK